MGFGQLPADKGKGSCGANRNIAISNFFKPFSAMVIVAIMKLLNIYFL